MNQNVYIISACRTPIGAYGGNLSTISAPELGAKAIKGALEKTNIDINDIESIVLGNVLSANLGQAPARQASKLAGLPDSVCATTVNKVCASGMKAVNILYNDILAGNCELGIAGGMENMSKTPHYIPNARFGIGYGNNTIIDGLAKDGLLDVYSQTSMGVSGDKTAEKYNISRNEQDNYAELSYARAADAWKSGLFLAEITEINIPQKKGEPIIISEDETYKKANFDKMRQLKPAFTENGTVTAANASPINDGASALIIAHESYILKNNIKASAKIIAYAEAEQEPTLFTTTPILATEKVLKKANLKVEDIDYFEVNEAFAVVPIAFMKVLEIPVEKVNNYGGAVALGHPLGSSGSRIIVTLLNILSKKKAKYGLATICNGGGGASAIIVENLNI
jgi:acetyl-CoA C-acetyltransferase